MYSLLSKKMVKESLLKASTARVLTAAPIRCAGDILKDKEKGDESIYFTKQDGKYFSLHYSLITISLFTTLKLLVDINMIEYREGT